MSADVEAIRKRLAALKNRAWPFNGRDLAASIHNAWSKEYELGLDYDEPIAELCLHAKQDIAALLAELEKVEEERAGAIAACGQEMRRMAKAVLSIEKVWESLVIYSFNSEGDAIAARIPESPAAAEELEAAIADALAEAKGEERS